MVLKMIPNTKKGLTLTAEVLHIRAWQGAEKGDKGREDDTTVCIS